MFRLDHRLFPGLGTSEVDPGCVLTGSAISASNSESLGKPWGLLRSTNEWFFSMTKKASCGQYSRDFFFFLKARRKTLNLPAPRTESGIADLLCILMIYLTKDWQCLTEHLQTQILLRSTTNLLFLTCQTETHSFCWITVAMK